MSSLTLIDGYIDEPACLGVPFFVSTYVRSVAGAAKAAGFSKVRYLTIEQLREQQYLLEDGLAVLIAGNPVPGKYLGGMPIKLFEFSLIAQTNPQSKIYCGGPIQFENPVFSEENLSLVKGDLESFVASRFQKQSLRKPADLNRFLVDGAFILRQHPRFPHLMAEIETGRGCPRKVHCSFCVEGTYDVDFRSPTAILDEMKALYEVGIRHFRFGKQADLFSYRSSLLEWVDGFPRPNPDAIFKLYSLVRENLPELKTLHLDNVNPGTIARFPDESFEIAKIIAKFNTPGDTAAFGMESADPLVQKLNHLKANTEQIFFAVQLINQAGSSRENGIPKLLPGINLIRGLDGENRDTFRQNYEFLKRVLDDGLLLKRINIRQLNRSNGTEAGKKGGFDLKTEKKLNATFRKYRKLIRDEIDTPMLKKLYPVGTKFDNVIVESQRGDWSLARQIASYPIVLNIPHLMNPLSFLSAVCVGYRERSLVALPAPLHLESASVAMLKQIPGLKKRASELFSKGKIRIEDLKEIPHYEVLKQYFVD